MLNEHDTDKRNIEADGQNERVVMPDDALIRAVGVAQLKGANKRHVEILARQVMYLRTQLNIIKNTFNDLDECGTLKDHVKAVREHSDEMLSKILEA